MTTTNSKPPPTDDATIIMVFEAAELAAVVVLPVVIVLAIDDILFFLNKKIAQRCYVSHSQSRAVSLSDKKDWAEFLLSIRLCYGCPFLSFQIFNIFQKNASNVTCNPQLRRSCLSVSTQA